MPEPQITQAVQLLDLMLEYFADDGHWTRGGTVNLAPADCLKARWG